MPWEVFETPLLHLGDLKIPKDVKSKVKFADVAGLDQAKREGPNALAFQCGLLAPAQWWLTETAGKKTVGLELVFSKYFGMLGRFLIHIQMSVSFLVGGGPCGLVQRVIHPSHGLVGERWKKGNYVQKWVVSEKDFRFSCF